MVTPPVPWIDRARSAAVWVTSAEVVNADAAASATELLRTGHSWAAAHAIHAARPSAVFPAGRFLLTLEPEIYEGTGVQAVRPDR